VSKQDFWTPWHHYTWGLGGVLLDTNDSQPTGTANNTITYTPGVSQQVNGVDQFFSVDWLGSTRYLTDSSGNSFPNLLRYDAFGERSDNGATGWDPSDYLPAGARSSDDSVCAPRFFSQAARLQTTPG
jgi:hypothetical protein